MSQQVPSLLITTQGMVEGHGRGFFQRETVSMLRLPDRVRDLGLVCNFGLRFRSHYGWGELGLGEIFLNVNDPGIELGLTDYGTSRWYRQTNSAQVLK